MHRRRFPWTPEKKRITLTDIDPGLHKRMKLLALMKGRSLKWVSNEVIRKGLEVMEEAEHSSQASPLSKLKRFFRGDSLG